MIRKMRVRTKRTLAATLAVTGAALVTAVSPAASAASSAPQFGPVSATVGNTENAATLEARLRPGGLPTKYEFWLLSPGCGAPPPTGVSCPPTTTEEVVAEGSIPADHLEEALSVNLTSLAWGTTYAFRVIASNSKGTVASGGLTFTTAAFAPGGEGGGSGLGQPYESHDEPWVEEGARRSAAEAVKREEERQARKKQEEEQAAGTAAAPASVTSCVVPSVDGESLKSAREALRRKHCQLGAVSGRRRGKLVVTHQSRKPGTELPAGTTIAVHLGAQSR